MKAMTAERKARLGRELDDLSKHAARCVVNAVALERRGDIDGALALFDKHAKAEARIKELLALGAANWVPVAPARNQEDPNA